MNFSFRCDGRPVAKADLAVVFSQGGETVYAYGDPAKTALKKRRPRCSFAGRSRKNNEEQKNGYSQNR